MIEWLQASLETFLESGSGFAYPVVFLLGVVASFLPCTYPVLPLTVGYVGNQAAGKKGKAFLVSLALVFGMALVYAVTGTILVLLEKTFGAIWANGYAVFAIAWFFIIMALFLLDVFSFPTPKFLMKLQSSAGGHRQGIAGAFLVGGVSGLVVGPCTGPVLLSVLAFVTGAVQEVEGVSKIWPALNGGFMLFLFGLGQGTLILLCGTFAGLLAKLPKSGQWMITIKKVFALLIIGGASFLFVHIGQNTDFPSLTDALASLESTSVEDDVQPQPASGPDKFGGDEFLE